MTTETGTAYSVEMICRALQKKLFRGNREEWGTEKEEMYQALETLTTGHGTEIVSLPRD
jgi:hypothetical protein